MSFKTEDEVQKLLQEPYWSLNEITTIATHHKFSVSTAAEFTSEVEKFRSELLEDVIEGIYERTIIPIDLTKNSRWKDRFTPYLEGMNVVFGILFLYLLAYAMQKTFDLLPNTYFAKSEYDPRYFGQIIMLNFVFGVMGFIILIWIALLIYRFIKKRSCKSPRDKFEYLMSGAKFRGLTENFFVSDNVIDLLNMKYRLNIPKDPFRVWKEPFFKRNGHYWIVGYQGKRVCLKDDKAMGIIAYLLNSPNNNYSASDLTKYDSSTADVSKEDTSFHADKEYQEYKNQMVNKGLTKSKLDEMIEILENQKTDAEESGLPETVIDCKNKIDHLTRYIKETFTKTGREKPLRDQNIRSQESLKKLIQRSIDELKNVHPPLALHLKCIRKTSIFCYRPPDDITWDVRF